MLFIAVWMLGSQIAPPAAGVGAELHRDYWANGSLKLEYTYVPMCNGEERKEGIESEWTESGQIIRMTEFREGTREGAETTWHENGELKSYGLYSAGEKTGDWVEWFDMGAV